jgi:energy-coupling factor transport system ATP-binding protein
MQKNKEVAIRFSNVVFGYSQKQLVPTIKNISFDIYDGEYICIVGSNGSGKSTISKILVGLLKP